MIILQKLVDKLAEIHCKNCGSDGGCGGCDIRTQIEEILEGEGVGKRPRKRIRCITTDMEFASLKDASLHYGVQSATISKCLNGKLKRAGSFAGLPLTWEYIREEE